MWYHTNLIFKKYITQYAHVLALSQNVCVSIRFGHISLQKVVRCDREEDVNRVLHIISIQHILSRSGQSPFFSFREKINLFWIWPYTTDWVCTQNGIHVFSLTHCWRGFYPDQASPRQYLCLPLRSVEDPFTTPSPSLSHTRSARPQSHSATRRSTEWESSKSTTNCRQWTHFRWDGLLFIPDYWTPYNREDLKILPFVRKSIRWCKNFPLMIMTYGWLKWVWQGYNLSISEIDCK